MTRRRVTAASLGHTQLLVLDLLVSGEKTVQHLDYDHPALSEDSARAAIIRLGRRSLVDVAGFDGNRRTYKLTEAGWAIVNEMASDENEKHPPHE